MKKVIIAAIVAVCANAHFLTFLPSTDIVTSKENSKITLDAMFIHPFEQTGMTMVRPEGIFYDKNKSSLLLEEMKVFGHKAWKSSFTIKRPGVYKFYTVPKPYFEPAEGKFISHVPKIMISAFGMEDGWDEPIGLEYEIVPLTKPFGLYSGNIFQGKVLHKGKAVANVEVEVELYNKFGLKAPTDAHITQVVKTDDNGIFSFVMNHRGWWGICCFNRGWRKRV